MSEKIFIRTKGEGTVFFAKVTKMRSIDFYRVERPDSIVASIADLDDASCAFLRLNKSHNLVITQEEYPNNTTWSYGGQKVRLGYCDQIERKMASGKTFVFREGDVYTDLDYITGTIIGYAQAGEKKAHILCWHISLTLFRFRWQVIRMLQQLLIFMPKNLKRQTQQVLKQSQAAFQILPQPKQQRSNEKGPCTCVQGPLC